MPAKLDTRDICRHCGQPIRWIEIKGREGWSSHFRWVHERKLRWPDDAITACCEVLGPEIPYEMRAQLRQRPSFGAFPTEETIQAKERMDADMKAMQRQMATPKNYCDEYQESDSQRCGRKVVYKDIFKCGIHGKGHEEVLARQERDRYTASIDRWMEAELNDIVSHLKEWYGIDATLETDGYSAGLKFSGNIIVNPGRLIQMLLAVEEEF